MWIVLHILIVIVVSMHILLRGHRQPTSRMAWLLVVVLVPYLGALAYLLLGQTSVGRGRIARLTEVFHDLPKPQDAPGWPPQAQGDRPLPQNMPLYHVGQSISGYLPVGGNRARLMRNSDIAIDTMVADIDAATAHVHVLFYIWLDDHNGRKMAEALMRAAARGVQCRAMVDDIGSRDLIKGPLWRQLGEAGVKTGIALKVGNPLLRMLRGRIDLRNHRKILVIDNLITYCGSQNCADPAFLPKAKFGPWVDAVMRFTGPVVRENQHLFISDWMGNGGDNIADLLLQPMPAPQPGFVAQVMGTGPTFRNSAMPEMFETLIYAARQRLIITTPYYVPDEALQGALCSAAYRGVDVTIIFPAHNDDFAVAATSRSYYQELLTAGVQIFEFQPGLLHTKSLTVDDDITLIGSANMDRRSFDLNYENNILLQDREVTDTMRARQNHYISQSRQVTLDEVDQWRVGRRLWNNAVAIVGPVL